MKCPWCNGEGGEVDVILDDGTGPFEMCGLCVGKGDVNLYHWILGHYWNIESWLKYPHSREIKKYWFSKLLCLLGLHTWYKHFEMKEYKCYICGKEQKEIYKINKNINKYIKSQF
jgi:hypothetical protein